jgi:DnaJ like chaperone protein
MNWIGKLLGGIFGFLLFRVPGAIFGVMIGHMFDKSRSINWLNLAGGNPQTQQHFFNATFSAMGHVAKADGRISEREIQLARSVMQRMGLQGERKLEAMRQFNLGKDEHFHLDTVLDQLHQVCQHHHLLKMFLELQVQTAYVDGTPTTRIKNLLQHISQRLGLGAIDFAQIENMFYGRWQQQSSSSHSQYQHQHQHRQAYQQPRSNIADAYTLLGTKSSASDAEVKLAYRRKMNENHPDKLMSKGLPKEMIELATEKTQKIKAAYEQIKAARK